MSQIDVTIILRAPEGEEMTDARLDAFYELGFDDAVVAIRNGGPLELLITMDDQNWLEVAKARAALLVRHMPDVEVIDVKLDD